MSRVVVGFDGSLAAQAALVWAKAEARLRAARLDAVVVVDERRGSPWAVGAELTARDVVQDAQVLGGTDITITLMDGKPTDELVRACTPDDLLVVGARGHSGVRAALLGSVTVSCLHHAPCPVAVIRTRQEPTGRGRRVIVGLDGSPAARAALQVGAEEARLRGAALQAIHAVRWDPIGTELVVPSTQQLRSWGRQLVEQQLAAAGVTARPVVIHGHPEQVLVRHSAQADLLVVGSHGHSALGGLLLGSISTHCAQRARCPLVVVRAR